MSQNSMEFGVGNSITFSTRMWVAQIAATTNSTTVSTAAYTAMNSPMMTILPYDW